MAKTSNVAVAGKKNVVLLPVADLKMTYDVRKKIDDDRVLFFMERYDSGAEVAPIKVIRGTTNIHDGRHRKHALEHLDRKHAECVFVEPMASYADQLMDAFGENVSDSPLPPTRADITFVMRQLLEQDVSHAEIAKRFARFYRPSHVRKLLKDAYSSLNKARMQKAVTAVAHGDLRIEDAAKEHGVKPETLRDELAGVRRRRRKTDISEMKSEISNRQRGNSSRNVAIIRNLFEKYEDGEASEQQVLEILLHIRKANASSVKRMEEWFERFDSLRGSPKAKK